MIHPTIDQVTAAPFMAELRAYSLRTFRLDLQAGATVAVFAVPQAMAYAMLAGLPPVHGLYAAAVMSIIAALWGSSPFLNTGPSNSSSLLAAAVILPLVGPHDLLSTVFQFTVLVGLIRIAMGLLRLGWLVRFAPESAFLGFITGSGLLIALGQAHHMLGVAGSHHPIFIMRLSAVIEQWAQANPYAIGITLGTLALAIPLNRFACRFPVALCVIGLATAINYFQGATWQLQTVGDVARMPRGILAPAWYPWHWSQTLAMLPAALAVAVIGLIESVSVGQSLAVKYRQPFNLNQEIFGQGISQLGGALCHGFPGSASFTRSVLVEQSGGQTRFANVWFGLCTAAALLLAPRWLEKIPVAALAGLLLYIGFKLIDVRAIRRVWQTDRADAAVMALTFFMAVFVKIEFALFVGMGAAMITFLHRARDLQLYELVPQCAERFEEIPYTPNSRHEPSDVVALSLHGDLFFGLAHALREQLSEVLREQHPRFIVVRTRRAHSIDYSCWNAIFDFAEAFAATGGKLYLSGVRPDLSCIVTNAGMTHILPPEQLTPHTESPWQAFEQTLGKVALQITTDAHLSPAWEEHLHRLQQGASVSYYKDPANDPATLGAVEV